MSTEINTRGGIRSKISSFPSGNDSECLSKQEIQNAGGSTLEISGSYGNAECVVLDDIGVVTWDYALSVSVSSLSFAAAGETKTFSVTSTKQKKVNGVNSGSPVSVGYSNSISGAGFSISGNSVSIGNNASASSRSGTVTVTQTESGKKLTVSLLQDAGQKVYGSYYDFAMSTSPMSISVSADGGRGYVITFSGSRKRDWTWNSVGDKITDTEILTKDYISWKLRGSTGVINSVYWLDNNRLQVINNTNLDSARTVYMIFSGWGTVGATVSLNQATGGPSENTLINMEVYNDTDDDLFIETMDQNIRIDRGDTQPVLVRSADIVYFKFYEGQRRSGYISLYFSKYIDHLAEPIISRISSNPSLSPSQDGLHGVNLDLFQMGDELEERTVVTFSNGYGQLEINYGFH